MIVCRDSYDGHIDYDKVIVKFEESDLTNTMFGIGFTFEHLIVPLHIKDEFLKSDRYKFIQPVIDCLKYGKIEYIDFKGEYREKQLGTLLD